jgi:ferrous iron transport protein A
MGIGFVKAIAKIRKLFLLIAISFVIMKLSELKSGEKARIKEFQSTDMELKLMEMGCIPGEEVVVEQRAPLGDPISIRVAGYSLSLRINEADQIIVEK